LSYSILIDILRCIWRILDDFFIIWPPFLAQLPASATTPAFIVQFQPMRRKPGQIEPVDRLAGLHNATTARLTPTLTPTKS